MRPEEVLSEEELEELKRAGVELYAKGTGLPEVRYLEAHPSYWAKTPHYRWIFRAGLTLTLMLGEVSANSPGFRAPWGKLHTPKGLVQDQ